MSYVNILAEAPDGTSKRIRVNQSGQLLAATADFPPNGSALLGSVYANRLQADSVPFAVADPNGRQGWYYSNTTLGDKMNWYYYSGTTNTLTFGELKQLTCVMYCDGKAPPPYGDGVLNVPFFVVYMKNGKTVIYQNQSATIQYIRGQKVLFYYSLDAFDYPQNPEQLREVDCPILVSGSDVPDPSDEVQYITVQSDSAFPAGTFSGVFSQIGFKFNDNVVEYELVAPASTGTGSDVNVTNTYLDTHANLYVGGEAVTSINQVPVRFNANDSSCSISNFPGSYPIYDSFNQVLGSVSGALKVNVDNATIDTNSTLYLNGAPVADGTNALPVLVNGTVVIDPLDTIDVSVVNTSIPITNTNLDTQTFKVINDTAYLNVSPNIPSLFKTAVYDPTGSNGLAVAVDGSIPITQAALDTMLFTSKNLQVQLFSGTNTISDTNPLVIRPVAASITTKAWTDADFSGTGVGSVSTAIEASHTNSITVFGTSTHSGGTGTNPTLTYQYSLDNITYFDTPYLITLANAAPFEDTRTLGVPWIRFKITSHSIDTLTLNICQK